MICCEYKPEGKIKVRLFEVVFLWHWHLSLCFSVKYHLFASVCSKPYCRTGCNPTPISFPVLFPKTCYSEFAAASMWQKSKKIIFFIHVPKSNSSGQEFSVSKEEKRWSGFRKKIFSIKVTALFTGCGTSKIFLLTVRHTEQIFWLQWTCSSHLPLEFYSQKLKMLKTGNTKN